MAVLVLATLLALLWMCYRASSLFKIPISSLVKLLGLDLPDPPRVSLHGIAADTITLHWSLPEKAGSVAKHIIQINGINVGESEKRGETSVTVTGLNPDHLYNVRVIAANAHNFQAPGELIRLRTRRKPRAVNGARSSQTPGKSDSWDDLQPHGLTEPPSQLPHYNHHNGSASSNSNSISGHSKRASKERKGFSAAQNSQLDSAGGRHTVESLTASLEAVRREIDETEAQLAHTEDEFRAAEGVMRAELDLLKEKKNEEDLGRQKLRAETKTLEKGKHAAEALKTKTEKALKHKEDEIKKMRNDSLRLDEERVAALEKVEGLSKAAEESAAQAKVTERELTKEIKETQKLIADLEEDIRSYVGSIKALEAQKEGWVAEEEAESKKAAEDENKERAWKERQRQLEMRYITIYNAYQVAAIDYARSREALLNSQGRRGSAGADPPIPPTKKQKQRRNRNRKSRAQTVSSSIGPLSQSDPRFMDFSSGSGTSIGQVNSSFPGGITGPFFNIANGTVSAPTESLGPIKTSLSMEFDRLSGIPMSPTANSLLPSNLFAFEDSSPSPRGAFSSEEVQSRSFGTDTLGFLPPQSPISSGSVSTSHVSSPRGSFQHIPMFSNMSAEGNLNESERAGPIAPIGSGLTDGGEESVSGGRRFVKLFSGGFNRQRGKTAPLDGGPLLGSLKPSESHSFPKSPHPPGLDPIGTRRRSGSYGSWTTNLEFLHGGRSKRPLERTDSTSSRRSAFNHFNPSFDPIEPGKLFDTTTTVSPRPSSIASFDNLLPAPSSDVSAAFGWPAPNSTARPQHKLSLLGAQWSDFASSRLGSSSSGSPRSPDAAGTASLFHQTNTPGLPHHRSSSSASSIRPATPPRLNPAAPTFEAHTSSPHFRASSLGVPHARSPSSISINTDESNHSFEGVPKDSSILSRISALSKKGSTSKFNISSAWKKDGGFFSRRSKDDGMGDDSEEITLNLTTAPNHNPNPNPNPSPLPCKDKTGFFARAAKRTDDGDDEGDLSAITTTSLAKESSPWGRPHGAATGFFGTIGRKRPVADKLDRDDASPHPPPTPRTPTTTAGQNQKENQGSGKEGLQGIFGRKRDREEGKFTEVI